MQEASRVCNVGALSEAEIGDLRSVAGYRYLVISPLLTALSPIDKTVLALTLIKIVIVV